MLLDELLIQGHLIVENIAAKKLKKEQEKVDASQME